MLREGTRARITYRIIYFKGGASDSVSHLYVDCTERYGVKGDNYQVRDGMLHFEPELIRGLRLHGDIYEVIGSAIAIACDGRAAVPVADPVRDAVERGREVSGR